jgi:hypothetical protein
MQKMSEKNYQHSLVEISQKEREDYCTRSISSICTIKISREWLCHYVILVIHAGEGFRRSMPGTAADRSSGKSEIS